VGSAVEVEAVDGVGVHAEVVLAGIFTNIAFSVTDAQDK
jgi:hypothetical protein